MIPWQIHLLRPCYDFTPVADLTVVGCLPRVSAPPSGKANSHGVTGGVYKARERIHRGMLIRDYQRFRLHALELQRTIRTETTFGDQLTIAGSRPIVVAIVAGGEASPQGP
eukprot:TRINITY_DN2362_c0_g1_i1.p1 TRINITY_DN2362_c0_g1~~TRINITY_DN2362_c0_g1_i1.p1  ORF type:complete len:111 (+),score=10.77 TRINITY_DN2362_c0_g1_i1:2-334(+)